MQVWKREKEENTMKEVMLYFEINFFTNQLITGINWIIQLRYDQCECLKYSIWRKEKGEKEEQNISIISLCPYRDQVVDS